MPHLEIKCLGPFSATLDGKSISTFKTDKVRALLVYLAVESKRPHRREHLAGLLWPDQSGSKALHSLRQALVTLRKALVDESKSLPYLLIERDTIQFNPQIETNLDVEVFLNLYEQDSASSRNHRRGGRRILHWNLRILRSALDLYRGDFLDQFFLSDTVPFEEWALMQREMLSRRAIEMLSTLLEIYEKRGDYQKASEVASRLVELAPWDERLHAELIRLFALQGCREAALAQYYSCRRILVDEMDVELSQEIRALFESLRTGPAAEGVFQLHFSPAPHNLTAEDTPFVGRERELEDLAEILCDPHCRQVTLHGPGGIGKSRLALEAAWDQVGLFADGVFWVALAPVNDPDQVLPAIADVLKFAFTDQEDFKTQFLNYLVDRQMLLVLDNFEHLLPAAGLLAEMLVAAPSLKLLVTSRERLNLHVEFLYQLEGLSYPKGTLEDGTDIYSYSGPALFVQRARRVCQDLAFSSEQASIILKICRFVEGLPLGLELAAAALWANTLEEVAGALAHNLDMLAQSCPSLPARHRSLRAAVEHSWQLLSKVESEGLARLAVFPGGFDRPAGLRIAGVTPEILASLMDKALLRRTGGRYDLHRLVRQYAVEKLEADPAVYLEVQARHAAYYAAFLQEQDLLLLSKHQKQGLERISLEMENVRQAWDWALRNTDAVVIEQCLESLYLFFDLRCRFQEGFEILERVFSLQLHASLPEILQARIQVRQGALLQPLNQYELSNRLLLQGLEVFEDHGDTNEQIFTLVKMGYLAERQGKMDHLEGLVEQILCLAKKSENSWGLASAHYLAGLAAYRSGEIQKAKLMLEQSLVLGGREGDSRLLSAQLYTLGDLACHSGDYSQARNLFEECLALSRESGDFYHAALHLNNLGTVWHVEGQLEQAEECYQQSLALYREISNVRGQAITLSNLGEIAFTGGLLDRAAGLFEEGLTLARQINNPWSIMACLNNLGEVYCARGDQGAALNAFAETIAVANKTRTLTMLTKVLVNLAACFIQQGRTHQAGLLLYFGCCHPASEHDNRRKARRLVQEFRLELPDEPEFTLEEVLDTLASEMDWNFQNPE